MDGAALSKLFMKLPFVEFSRSFAHSCFVAFVNDAITTALLHGKGRDRIIMVSWREVDEPSATFFAFSSTRLLLFTPTCPGTHCI